MASDYPCAIKREKYKTIKNENISSELQKYPVKLLVVHCHHRIFFRKHAKPSKTTRRL